MTSNDVDPQPPDEAAPHATARTGVPAGAALASRREWLWAAAITLVLLVVFLWKPLTSGGVYGPADLTQTVPILRTEPAGFEVANPFLGDVAVDIMPWHVHNREVVRDGRLPLWNPYNESGVPHLANGQSAVFSPFTVPYYVAPLRLAFLVSMAAAFALASLATYGLARRLGVGHWGGIVAATGYAYAGVIVFWANWTLLQASALIPAMAWAAVVTLEGATARRRVAGAAAFTASLAAGVLSGHPETTFYGLGGVVVLLAVRLASGPAQRHDAPRRLGGIAAAGLLGAAIAAVQILPTLEYLSVRAPSGNRQAFVDADLAGLALTPFVHGSPFGANRIGLMAEAIPYAKSAPLALSVVLVLFAVVGVIEVLRRRPRLGAGLVALALAWLVVALDLGGIGTIVMKLPGIELVMALRSIPLAALGTAIVAGHGLSWMFDESSHRAAPASPPLAVLGGATAAVIVAVVVAAFSLRGRFAPPEGSPVDLGSIRTHHLAFLLVWLVVAALATAAWRLGSRRGAPSAVELARLRPAGALVVVVALFATSGFLWRDFNPTVPVERFYPWSEAVTALSDRVGDDLVLGADDSEIPPGLNLVYGIRSPYNYDAIGVGAYHEVFRRLLDPPRTMFSGTHIGRLAGPVTPKGIGGLRMLGIQWVTTATTYPWAEATIQLSTGPRSAESATWTVAPRHRDRSDRITDLVFHDLPDAATSCTVDWTTAGAPEAPLRWRGACSPAGTSVALDTPVPFDAGLEVHLRVLDAAGEPIEPSKATAATAVSSAVSGLALEDRVAGFSFFRVTGSPAFGFSPASTAATDPGHAIVDAPDADPNQRSVIDAPDGASTGEAPGVVEVIRNDAGRIELEVTRTTPGWVIVGESHYPGWTATVNGRSTPVRVANETFLSTPVPAGTSRVTFDYRPTSFTVGAAVSVASTVVALVGYGLLAARARRRDPGTDDPPAP